MKCVGLGVQFPHVGVNQTSGAPSADLQLFSPLKRDKLGEDKQDDLRDEMLCLLRVSTSKDDLKQFYWLRSVPYGCSKPHHGNMVAYKKGRTSRGISSSLGPTAFAAICYRPCREWVPMIDDVILLQPLRAPLSLDT